MPASYIPLLVAVVLAATIAAAMVAGSYLLGPRKPNRFKAVTYECGMTPVGDARRRFPVHFYLVAMGFIVFDVELAFLYPWAAMFSQGNRAERLFLLGEMAVFTAVLAVAYVYVVGTRALDWSPEAEAAEEGQPLANRRAFAPRAPIRFGNESSGPVQIRAREGVHE